MVRIARPFRFLLSASIVVLFASQSPADPVEHWRQWGGPGSDFVVNTPPLLDAWPEDGPKSLWSHDLGDGYSAIAFDEGKLFTLYRDGEQEIVVCLSADTGQEVWRHTYEAKLPEKFYKDFGVGPRAMPVVHGDHVFTAGVNGTFHAFDKATGKVQWKLELIREMGGTELGFGYSNPPLVYKDKLIVLKGGKGDAVLCVDPSSGKIEWKALDFQNSYAAPLLIEVEGQEQIVAFMGKNVIGFDPGDGELLWKVHMENQWGTNCSMPVFGPDNHLFVSTEETGTRVLKLSKDGAKEVWFNRRPQVVFTNAVRFGGVIVAAVGVKTAPLTALDLETGETLWRTRKFNKASLVLVGGRLLALDEDGSLGIGTVTRDGYNIQSKIQLFEKNAWTVPTIVGSRLFCRDRKKIVALELGAGNS